LQVRVGDLTDGGPIDIDVADVELADGAHVTVPQVHDGAVLGDDRALARDAGLDRKLRVRDEVASLAVHGHDVAGTQNVVRIEQFTRGRVPRNVDFRVALVHDGRAEFHEAI